MLRGAFTDANEIGKKALVGLACGKIATGSDAQRLIDGLFELMMRLLTIAIFMGNTQVVLGWLHPIMRHQRIIATGPVTSLLLACVLDCRGQMIGAMLLGNPTDLEDALSQCPRPTLQTIR